MAILIREFVGFEYANAFKMAETGGNLAGTSTSIINTDSVHPKETSCLELLQHKTNSYWNGAWWASNENQAIKFYVKFRQQLPPVAAIPTVEFVNCGGVSLKLERNGANNHNLVAYDTDSDVIMTVADPFTINTWHLVTLQWAQLANPNLLSIYVDDVYLGSDWGDVDIGGNFRVIFKGQGGDPLGDPADATVVRINSHYSKNALIADSMNTSDYLGPYQVIPFQPDKDDATPDCTDAGAVTGLTDLDAGDWHDTADGLAAVVAQYIGTHNGACSVREPAGPRGYMDSAPLAGKWGVCGVGARPAANFELVYGLINPYPPNVGYLVSKVAAGIGGLGGYFWQLQDATEVPLRVPGLDEHYVIGFSNQHVLNAIEATELWCMSLHPADSAAPEPTVHVKGGAVKGGAIK